MEIKEMKNKTINYAILLAVLISILTACTPSPNNTKESVFAETPLFDADNLKHIKQEMVSPPALPKHEQVAEGDPVVVEVTFFVEEKEMEIAPGVKTWGLTFNGTVPGPLIVVHQDDYVQLTLINAATNTMVHNIDFHAATGAMGGGDISNVAPGEQVTFRFKATKAGVFVYHCAPGGIMVPLHVVSGMNGAIMVLPRDGLKDELGNPVRYDKAFYIAEQDFYIPKDENGNYKEYDSPAEGFPDLITSMKTLLPTHLLFNGKMNALTGDKALEAKVGEKVLFITSQANRDTRIHLIGGHADLVWLGGSFNDAPATNYESWSVVGGSAVAALYQFRQPGTYTYLNHNLIEAILFGAVAQLEVEGDWNDDLMKQIKEPEAIP
ncbi:copper-containing nitrite reductase [Sunxiuqinia dokdonensis]|uniref:Copper-containing nitrite reductase n=1 Tax=Sunxiuqinia dokdonensis TaxID=1409788 RepID=A0A0L8V5N5_9BACT|nr:copper-containing nitrite reductase [Sunxiuqinia dokdonensis]KOH43527.1 nitrite reductase [Sunxiuqinia dokdonensis]